MKLSFPLVIFAVAAAMAQIGPGQPAAPSVTEVKTYLGLTDTQITSLQVIQKQAQTAVQNLETQIRQKQSDLDTLLSKGTTDAAAGKLLIDINTLRKQVDSTIAPYRDQAKAVLTTADQKAKLKTLDDASKLQTEIREAIGLLLIAPTAPAGAVPGGIGRRGFGGPGPMGGPGGGPGPRGFRPPQF